MQKLVKPTAISGTVAAPASKSMLQRVIAAALLSDTPVNIRNGVLCDDAAAALRVATALGAVVTVQGNTVAFRGGLKPTGESLHCGESGLSLRMFAPIAALCHLPLTLTGSGALLSRPVTMMENTFAQLGVQVTTTGGHAPLTVQGPLRGGQATVDGSLSSQFLTGLLLALPNTRQDSILTVLNLKSTPYIDMTLQLLADFAVEVTHRGYESFFIKGNQSFHRTGGDYTVEGDWSGAAFLLVAGAIGGEVTVTGLESSSSQADRRILEVLSAVGADVLLTAQSVTVRKKSLQSFTFDASHCPDLFPPLAVLACNCTGTSVITGVQRLIHKESNRAVVLEKELNAIGGNIHLEGDRMIIRGQAIRGGQLQSHNDHRIVMVAALAGINASGPITIDGAECVAKSYPHFFDHWSSIQSSYH